MKGEGWLPLLRPAWSAGSWADGESNPARPTALGQSVKWGVLGVQSQIPHLDVLDSTVSG